MASYLITGTSRGIGLELTKQLLDLPSTQIGKVFAVTRNNTSTVLNELLAAHPNRATNIIIKDLTNSADLKEAAAQVSSQLHGSGLDVLVNNAGIGAMINGGIEATPPEKFAEVFHVNVLSVHVVTAAFLPLLEKGKEKKVINISTTVGSIGLSNSFARAPVYPYKVAKAALNMLNAQYAIEYADKGFTFLLISPGWLKTDLGSQHADLDVSVGVAQTKKIILEATPSLNGKFMNIHVPGWEDAPGANKYDGKEVPW